LPNRLLTAHAALAHTRRRWLIALLTLGVAALSTWVSLSLTPPANIRLGVVSAQIRAVPGSGTVADISAVVDNCGASPKRCFRYSSARSVRSTPGAAINEHGLGERQVHLRDALERVEVERRPTMIANRLQNVTAGGPIATPAWNAEQWDVK